MAVLSLACLVLGRAAPRTSPACEPRAQDVCCSRRGTALPPPPVEQPAETRADSTHWQLENSELAELERPCWFYVVPSLLSAQV